MRPFLFSSAYEDIVKIVAEAQKATQQAQNSVAEVQAQILLDDDKTIAQMSHKSMKTSKEIEDRSKDLSEKRELGNTEIDPHPLTI